MPHRDLVSRPVVFNNARVIHGKVGRLLFEIGDRVATRRHDVAKEPVRFTDRAGGVVKESRLHEPALDDITVSGRGFKRPNVIFFDSLLNPRQLRFGAIASSLADGALVFGTETFAKSL